MNALKNRVQLIGRLGQDPEVKTFDGGKRLARFSMATSEQYKTEKGEKVTDTQWHNVIAWNGTARIVEKLLKKGCEVAIEGKLTNRSWEDADGGKHYITEIVAQEVLLLKSKE
ncbi:MAG: single-stranded DNA-binding protein [Bacteroidales bacterium]